MESGRELLLTVEQCAKRLQLGRSHTYKFILSGELPSITLGKSRRVPVGALEGFIARLVEEQSIPTR